MIREFLAEQVLETTDCATREDTFADLVLVRRDHFQSNTIECTTNSWEYFFAPGDYQPGQNEVVHNGNYDEVPEDVQLQMLSGKTYYQSESVYSDGSGESSWSLED